MAQRTLNAFVVLSGRVDNTFGQIGTALINMGSTVDEISQKLINFGKESIEVYRGYQDSMLDAQVALSTIYGRGTRELASVMETLDAQATEWAASTIFHTDDVANAIAQAAHANWDLDMILTGIPNAMRLAQAGSMDLSEAVDFIVKSTNGAGLEFQDLTEFIDEWTFAANSSAGNVEQFGEAMLKMGNTMQFAENKEELLAMLAVLHDSGAVGATAGTLLRNTMIRLIAPTKKANDAMAQLKITQDEVDEAMSEVDGDTAAAVAKLEELGFSVYDDTGALKDFMTIFADLDKATSGMTDDEKYKIWSALFPTRTITGGMALIDAAKDKMSGLYAALAGGDAAGYGEYAAETMMSGLTGDIETFLSKVERLKQVTGEELADDVTYWTDKLGEFVDSVAEMDSANFSGLVGGLEIIAGAGPGLVIAGSAFRFLGFALGTNAGRIALAALAIAALSKAVGDYQEQKFAENFGTMELDTGPLVAQLEEIDGSFENSTGKINGFKNALQGSIDKYNEASQTFASKLLTDMITGNELTDDDLQAYRDYGETMINAVKDGMKQSADMSAEFWAYMFKGAYDTGDEYAENPIYQGLIKLLREDYDENIAEVEAIGEGLRGAITAAFDNDGIIDQEEYEKIKSYYRALNEAMARAQREAADEAEQAELRLAFDKAQNLSYKDMMKYLEEEIYPRRQAKIDQITDETKQEAYAFQIQYEKDYAAATTDEERAAVDQHWNETLGGKFASGGALSLDFAQPLLDAKLAEIYSWYDPQIMRLMEPALHESDIGEADALIENLVSGVLSGAMSEQDAYNTWELSQYSKGKAWTGFGTGFLGTGLGDGASAGSQAAEYYDQQIAMLGGRDAMQQRIDLYKQSGMIEAAESLAMILAKSDFYKGQVNNSVGNDVFWWMGGAPGENPYSLTPEKQGEAPAPQANTIGLDGTMYGPDTGNVIPLEPIEQQSFITFPNADSEAAAARAEVESHFSTPITQTVNIQSGGGGLPAVNERMAKGGRATKPAIFAEAGKPEWFIPEEHTPETAALIARTAEASGFSLAELAEMTGAEMFAEGGVYGSSASPHIGSLHWGDMDYSGMDDGGSGRGDTMYDVHYAPVIHAENAEGVDRALKDDKKRLKKLLQEIEEERELIGSVVKY